MRVAMSIQDGILRFAPPRPRAKVDPARWLLVGWEPEGAVSALTPLGGVLSVRPSSDKADAVSSQIRLPKSWFWISLPRLTVAGRLEVGIGAEGKSFLLLKSRYGAEEVVREANLIPARDVSEVVEVAVWRALNAIHQGQSPLRDLATLLSMSSLVRLESDDKMVLWCRVGQAMAQVELSGYQSGVGVALPLIPKIQWLVPSKNDFLVLVQSDPLRSSLPMIVGELEGWSGLGVIGALEPRLWLEAVGGSQWDPGD
jgi:hypothetical protein